MSWSKNWRRLLGSSDEAERIKGLEAELTWHRRALALKSAKVCEQAALKKEHGDLRKIVTNQRLELHRLMPRIAYLERDNSQLRAAYLKALARLKELGETVMP